MKKLSPLRAIREYCLECSGHSTKEVKECRITDCQLYSFRLGKNNYRKGIGSVGNLSKETIKAANVSVGIDTQENSHSNAENISLRESGTGVEQHISLIENEGSGNYNG